MNNKENNKNRNNKPNNIVLPEKYVKKNDRIFLYQENETDSEIKKNDTFM